MAKYVKDGIVYDDNDVQANAGSGGFFGTSNDVQADISASIALEEIREIERRIDSDVARVDSDIAMIDSDIAYIEELVADVDSDVQLAKDWAVGPNPPAEMDGPSDTNNSFYWSEVAKNHAGHGDSDGARHYAEAAKSWAVGDTDLMTPIVLGNDTDNAMYWSQQSEQWAIDTDIDTFPEGSAKYWAQQAMEHAEHFTVQDQRGGFVDSETTVIRIDTSTGLEAYEVSPGTVGIREYVAPDTFEATIDDPQEDFSWFNTDSDAVAQVSATGDSSDATVISVFGGQPASVMPTINPSDNTQVLYNIPADAGTYGFNMSVSGSAPAGTGTIFLADQWVVYRDYFIATNVADGAVPGTAGRQERNIHTSSFVANGHTFITVAQGVSFTLSDAFGDIPLDNATNITLTLNGVSHDYTRYSLGDYTNNTINITV